MLALFCEYAIMCNMIKNYVELEEEIGVAQTRADRNKLNAMISAPALVIGGIMLNHMSADAAPYTEKIPTVALVLVNAGILAFSFLQGKEQSGRVNALEAVQTNLILTGQIPSEMPSEEAAGAEASAAAPLSPFTSAEFPPVQQ